MIKKYFYLFLIISLLNIGCGDDRTVITSGPSITGTVVQYSKGSPVINSTVTLLETGISTMTDENGYFSFNNIEPGFYTLLLSKKGCSASMAQSVNGGTSLELIQMPYFNPLWPVSAPYITVSGISEGDVITDKKTIAVSAAGAGNIKGIYVKTGYKYGYPSAVSKDNSSVLSFELDPAKLPPGNNYLYIVVYDINNNRSELTINIKNGFSSPATPPVYPPKSIRVTAYTFGESCGEYYRRVENFKKKRLISRDIDPFIVKINDNLLNLRGLPADATCYVSINCTYEQSDATSYKLYRSISKDGPFTWVATSSSPVFTDGDPSVIYPGQKLYYKMSACNVAGESPLSDISHEVTVLDLFRVNLTEPSDNTTGVSTKPVLKWSVNNRTGVKRVYDIYIWDVNREKSEPVVIEHVSSDDINESSVNLSAELKKNAVYEWDVFNTYAAGSYDETTRTYRAYSYPSYPYMDLNTYEVYFTSNNGSFIFTTVSE
ncbi:MAG: carboxypeptidase regulatory-like domain-containing protein [Candidatus Eremiobacterota bacterium]